MSVASLMISEFQQYVLFLVFFRLLGFGNYKYAYNMNVLNNNCLPVLIFIFTYVSSLGFVITNIFIAS